MRLQKNDKTLEFTVYYDNWFEWFVLKAAKKVLADSNLSIISQVLKPYRKVAENVQYDYVLFVRFPFNYIYLLWLQIKNVWYNVIKGIYNLRSKQNNANKNEVQ